jgi:AcrR family transcriptional regulator
MMSPTNTGQRGPVEHERREQIVSAAGEHFGHYGYKKTTVADLAKSIGLSTAYIYKFFESKQAIGEAICSSRLRMISDETENIARQDKPAAERLRNIFRSIAQQSVALFFHDRKIYELASTSFEESWQSGKNHFAMLQVIVESVVRDGREAGEFERKTPLHETSRAIMLALQLFHHPVLLEQKLDTLDEDATLMANLVLRSLAP